MSIWCHLTVIWFDSGSYDHPSNWQTASCHCGVKIKQPRDKFLFLSTFCWACVPAESLRLWRTHFAGRSKFNDQPAIRCDGIPQSIERVKGQLIQDEIMVLDCRLVACELALLFPPQRRQPRGHVTTASTGGYAIFRLPRVNGTKPQRPRRHRRTRMLARSLPSPAGISAHPHAVVCMGIHLTTS